MKNPVKVGDKITVDFAQLDKGAQLCARDTSQGTVYEVTHVGTGHEDLSNAKDVVFFDDVGDKVVLHFSDVTVVETADE
jgi:hypothetical protein